MTKITWPPLLRSLRAQLAVCFVLLGAALAIGLSATLGSMLAEKSRNDAGAALHTVANNAARLLADGLHLRLREVEVLAGSPTLWSEGLASPRVEQTLYRSQTLNPYSAWIGVVDSEGVVRMSTGRLLVGTQVRERPWFAAGRQGPHVGDVHGAKLLGKLLPPGRDGGPQRFVDFAAPIYSQGQLLGVLGIHGSWEWTRATIESLLPESSQRMALEVFVFDREGRMIYAPDGQLEPQLARGQRLPALADAAASARGAAPTTAASAAQHKHERNDTGVARWRDARQYLTATALLPARSATSDLGWTVVARQPVAVAHEAAQQGAAMALLLGGLMTLLAAALGWLLAGRLTQPLRRIAQDAQALQAAATPIEMPARQGSLEVEQLSNALSGMTRRLLQANAQLEQRVQARTVELERANAALAALAHEDPLTGLLNRRGLDERLGAAVASARRRRVPLSLLVLDADHFKRVNDTFGHEAGDQVLRGISRAMRQRLREVDFVARVGGEEFVAVLPDTGSLGASHVAETLLQAVRQTAMGPAGHITVSCGVATLMPGAESPAAALRRADAALYLAKQSGRNRFCVAADAEEERAAEAEQATSEPVTSPL